MDSSMNEALPPPKQERTISRREILSGAVGLGAAMFVGCGEETSGRNPTVTKFESPTPTLQPTRGETSTPTAAERVSIISNKSIDLYVDGNDVAIKYTLKNNGTQTTVPIDRQRALTTREAAIQNKEPEILELIKYDDEQSQMPSPTAEHYAEKKLPPDVVADSEIQRRGVKIIQADNTNLFIRQAAFGPGGPLEKFSGTGKKLNIVLINGPIVHPYYMKDSRYDSVRSVVNDYTKDAIVPTPEQYRAAELTRMQIDLATARRQKDQAAIMSLKVDIRLMQQQTESELMGWILCTRNSKSVAGLCISPLDNTDTTAIFVTVGVGPKYDALQVISSNQNGITQLSSTRLQYAVDDRPNPLKSFPNTSQLKPNLNPSSNKDYIYAGGGGPGFTLLHELGHANDRVNAMGGIVGNITGGGILGDNITSEASADAQAGKNISRGSSKWTGSNFTDNSGYYFTFSVPKELGGGYIITKNLNAKQDGPLIF